MSKIYKYFFFSLVSVFILSCFALCASADTGVVRRSQATSVRVFPYGSADVPTGYKLAYVNYMSTNQQPPYNPAYIYATYVPAECDYIIVPDIVGSDGVQTTNSDVYLQGHMPDGTYANLFTVASTYRSYNPDTNQPSANYDNYRLDSEIGSYSRVPVWYNTLYMPAKRPNGADFYEPTQLSMDVLLTDDKQLHFTCSITGQIAQNVPIDYILIPSAVDVGNIYHIQPNYDRSMYLTSDGYIYTSLDSNNPLTLGEAFRNVFRRYVFPDSFPGWDDTSTRVSIPIPYLSEFSSVALPANFDINDYTSDYVGIGGDIIKPTVHRTSVFTVDVPSMDNASANIPLYQYDNIGVIAVARFPNKIEVARFDFSRSQIMNSKHTPAVTHTPIDNIDAPTGVETLQDLADYMQYVYNTTNSNNYTIYNNAVSDLQSIPWDNYITNGFANFMPSLNAELRDLFGGLGDDWFTLEDADFSDLNDRQDQLDELIDYKFGWYTDFQDEVEYIHTTIIDSGNDMPDFSVNFNGKFGLQEVTIIDFSKVPYTVRDKVRDVISVFATLAVIMYIWKTIPSTIGNEPN